MSSTTVNTRGVPAAFALTGPESLTRLREPSTKRAIRRIEVVDPALPTDVAAQLERRLNRWYFACGCEQGSMAVLVTLLACSATGLVAGFDGPFEWWRIVGYVMAAALGGKALGLAYAKARLRGLYRRLETHYGRRELKERLQRRQFAAERSAAEVSRFDASSFHRSADNR